MTPLNPRPIGQILASGLSKKHGDDQYKWVAVCQDGKVNVYFKDWFYGTETVVQYGLLANRDMAKTFLHAKEHKFLLKEL